MYISLLAQVDVKQDHNTTTIKIRYSPQKARKSNKNNSKRGSVDAISDTSSHLEWSTHVHVYVDYLLFQIIVVGACLALLGEAGRRE